MIRTTTTVALALVILTGGCASKDPRTLPAPLTEIKPSVTLKAAWQASIGKSAEFVFAPAVVDKRVYAMGIDGELAAFDLSTGQRLWRTEVGKIVSGGVGGGNGIVVVGTQKGQLLAFDSEGKSLWKSDFSAELLAPASIDRGVVVI